MVKAYLKRAFTLIELVFAIIIMGIVAMSIPVIMQITSKGIEDSIIQEAVFAASAELMGATTYAFDASSYADIADINDSSTARVVDINSNCDLVTRLKNGHIAQPFHRRCTNENTTVQNSLGSGDFENIYNTTKDKESLFTDNSTSSSGYKKHYKISVGIDSKDIDNTTNNEMRKISATIFDEDDNTLVGLSTFVSNIGDIEFYHKVME